MTQNPNSPLQEVRPEGIEIRSLAIIDAEVPEPRVFQGGEWEVARRMVHASADFELLELIRFHPLAVEAGVRALSSGCMVVTDTQMGRAGIPVRRMDPLGCRVECLMGDEKTAALAKELGVTRAHAAMNLAASMLTGGIAVIGNAPTALIRLLELMEQGKAAPALIVGMPVGFVNAAESKELLMARETAGQASGEVVPYITVQGRKGGTTLAAATVNALAEIALRQRAEGESA